MNTEDRNLEGLNVSRRQFLNWSLAAGAVGLAGSTGRSLASINEAEAQMSAAGEVPQRPFPQHAVYTAGTIKPNIAQETLDEKTQTFYKAWREFYLRRGFLAGCRPGTYYVYVLADHNDPGGGMNSNSITVSEAHGYGMMIIALMAGYDPKAKIYFDGLYKFYKAHPSGHNKYLMAWNQVKGCKSVDRGTATDGDLDIAYALLLADRQWGSDGAIDYFQEATGVINAIMDKEINPDTSLPMLADREEFWLQKPLYKFGTRTSDFMVDHMRAYLSATGNTGWSDVIDAVYTLIETMQTQYSPLTGLLPDFVQNTDTAPQPARPRHTRRGPKPYLETFRDGQYSWNACRVPWRIGADYLTSGDTRALDALDKINAWLRSKTGDDPTQIYSGYELDGTRFGKERRPMAFVTPFGVGAMVSTNNQEWLDKIWNVTVNRPRNWEDYYGNTLKLLAMITMSGNWWKP